MAEVSVAEIGHISPNSDWVKMYWKLYLTIGGTLSGQPSTPPRRDMAWMPNSE